LLPTTVRSRATTTTGRSIMVGLIRRKFQVVCADGFGVFVRLL
jgi:hypothetical protein